MKIISANWETGKLELEKDGKRHTRKIYFTKGDDGHCYVIVGGKRWRFDPFAMEFYQNK